MRRRRARSGFAFLALLLTAWGCTANDRAAPAGESGQAEATLSAWADGEAKAAILSFVDRVTDASGPDFVPASERIAVFDNDGTLWAEKPLYFQLFFALDRVPVVAAERPELMESALIRAIVEGDQARIAAMDHRDIFEVATATHSGITVAEFQQAVRDWLQSARHQRFDRRYDELLYQPMLELLDYLRTNDFRVFIVSGGGIDFIRVFAETAYGIPPEQVVGSSTSGEFELREDGGVIVKGPDIASVNDRAVKPVNINLHIGRKPILAFGNSDGDLQMLQYTDSGDGPRLALILRHDDPDREWQYDRESSVGRLDEALDVAVERGWTVVSIRDDFRRVFSFEP